MQRPNIGESIAVDMLLLRRLMGVIDRNVPQVRDRRKGRLEAGAEIMTVSPSISGFRIWSQGLGFRVLGFSLAVLSHPL